ncbi:MAG: glycosyltransferase family 4 protein [Bacteroidota bacterium]
MKLLQLSPQFPFPLSDGGKISIVNMTRALVQQGCEVDVLCLSKLLPSKELIDEFRLYTGAHCTCITHDTSNSPIAILRSLFDLKNPLYMRKHRSTNYEIALINLITEQTYDGILCDHTAMAEYGLKASHMSHIPVVLRMHNIEHIIWERYADRFSSLDPRKVFILSQVRKLKQKEVEYASLMQHCAMITEQDVDILQEYNQLIKATYVPVGIDTKKFHPKERIQTAPHTLIHATTYDWVHNVEAIDWFISEVMPTIHKEYAAELHLLGKHMPDRYRTMKDIGIIGKGFVENMNDMLNNASIYIAPLFVGAGIRIKILEAMSAGLPVIASKISAEGIKANREDGLIVCNDATEFIMEISYLIQNPDQARLLGEKARSFILQHHSWERSAERMKELFQR